MKTGFVKLFALCVVVGLGAGCGAVPQDAMEPTEGEVLTDTELRDGDVVEGEPVIGEEATQDEVSEEELASVEQRIEYNPCACLDLSQMSDCTPTTYCIKWKWTMQTTTSWCDKDAKFVTCTVYDQYRCRKNYYKRDGMTCCSGNSILRDGVRYCWPK